MVKKQTCDGLHVHKLPMPDQSCCCACNGGGGRGVMQQLHTRPPMWDRPHAVGMGTVACTCMHAQRLAQRNRGLTPHGLPTSQHQGTNRHAQRGLRGASYAAAWPCCTWACLKEQGTMPCTTSHRPMVGMVPSALELPSYTAAQTGLPRCLIPCAYLAPHEGEAKASSARDTAAQK